MKPIIWLIVHGRCIRPLFLGMRFCKFKKIAKESVQLKRACQKVLTTFDDIEAICEEKDTDFLPNARQLIH